MGWALNYIKELQAGNEITFRPRGNSMVPLIKSGDQCTVEPITDQTVLKKNDIVLCKVNGNEYLHKVTGIKTGQVQISNNKGHVNGWTSTSNVFGLLTKVES